MFYIMGKIQSNFIFKKIILTVILQMDLGVVVEGKQRDGLEIIAIYQEGDEAEFEFVILDFEVAV